MELEVPEIKRNLSVNEYQRLRSRSLSPDPRHLSPQPPVRMILLWLALATLTLKGFSNARMIVLH